MSCGDGWQAYISRSEWVDRWAEMDRLVLAAEISAVQNSGRELSDAATSDSRYKNRREGKRAPEMTNNADGCNNVSAWDLFLVDGFNVTTGQRGDVCVCGGEGADMVMLMVCWLKQGVKFKQPLNKPIYLSDLNCQSKSVWKKRRIIGDWTTARVKQTCPLFPDIFCRNIKYQVSLSLFDCKKGCIMKVWHCWLLLLVLFMYT